MIDARNPKRISPRQAIVAVYEPPSSGWAADLAVPLLLDVLGALVAVNGATLVVTCSSIDVARTVADSIPAGVDLMVPPAGEPGTAAHVAARELATAGFERILLTAADTIGLSPRILTTALSVLASEPRVFGISKPAGLYLAGAHLSGKSGDLDAVEHIADLFTGAVQPRAGVRMEPRTRLRALESVHALKEAFEGYEKVLVRTMPVAKRLVNEPS